VMELGLEVTTIGSHVVVQVSGEIDISSAPRLREAIVGVLAEGRTQIAVDLREVDFLDSTGLGVLVGGLKRARSAGGELRVISTSPRIAKVFAITGLDGIFQIVEQPEDLPVIEEGASEPSSRTEGC
jgi:anti-sigma B factor antagonist